MKAQRKGMKAGPTANASPEQLRAEYQAHLGMANHYLKQALQAEATGGPGVSTLFQKVQVEQNAALLCQQQMTMIMMGAVIGLLNDLFGEDGEGEERAIQ